MICLNYVALSEQKEKQAQCFIEVIYWGKLEWQPEAVRSGSKTVCFDWFLHTKPAFTLSLHSPLNAFPLQLCTRRSRRVNQSLHKRRLIPNTNTHPYSCLRLAFTRERIENVCLSGPPSGSFIKAVCDRWLVMCDLSGTLEWRIAGEVPLKSPLYSFHCTLSSSTQHRKRDTSPLSRLMRNDD